MIQDIAPIHLHNEFQYKKPKAESRMLAYGSRMIFLDNTDEKAGIRFITYEQLNDFYKESGLPMPSCIYLFEMGGEDYFLIDIPKDTQLGGFAFHTLFSVRRMHPKEKVYAATTGWHLYGWYRDNRFCGRCAHELVHDAKERMLRCPSCGNLVFPKIAPAVIIGLVDGDRIMMTKYADREYKRYALIAGFTEIGETAEETVRREVMEEVGLEVKNIRYYKSQPWGFDQNLLMGFFCDLAKEAPIRLEEDELCLAEWVDYHDIPDDEEGLSLTHEMMIYFRESKRAEVW